MNYQYVKDAVSSDRLAEEIRQSAITVALDYITTDGADLTIFFKATLSAGEETVLDGIVATHDGTPLPQNEPQLVKVDAPKTTSGLSKVSIYEPEGDSATVVSHDFADPCSWYQGAEEIIGEALGGSGTVFTGAHQKWIDLEHGRLYDEDNVMLANANKYRPKIYVDAVLQTEGFTIDYPTGTVTFEVAPEGTVTADYWRADKSWYILKPKEGKILSIKATEVQFCKNTTLNSPFVFEVWVNHPQAGLIPVPGTKIVYKNFKDFISACNEGQGIIPQIGDMADETIVFPFHYARPKAVKYSQGLEIRVYNTAHQPCGGSFATATFYVTVENES